MKYTVRNRVGNVVSFAFPNKREEEEYLSICADIWGGAPVEVDWARNTNAYINAKKKRDKVK